MADVLIVCVREDELQAKALADMFERAGFTVGGAPASDGALRSTGAGVIVWSQASIRSRPFLDAAQRVIDAEKAVVASLIDPPPPDSIGDAPAFALNGWTGDPEDPALDPLFFAVDRMVNSQRASVGATPTQPAPAAFEEPPSLRPAPLSPTYARPMRAAPPQAAPPPMMQAPADPLGSEAEHWRAIRNSRNASDFMDYLARYGPDGAFSDVAELRLRQLTSQNPTPSSVHDAARTQAPRRESARVRSEPPPPVRRPDPPPQARRPEPAPVTRLEPPPRRSEPPPRRDPPARAAEPIFNRNYDPPPAQEREAGGGGMLRILLLVLLLGGGALAAGLYYTGDTQPPAQQAALDDTSLETLTPTELGVGGSETAEEPVTLTEAQTGQTRREREREERRLQQQRERERQQAAAEEADAVVPAPQTSWTGAQQAAAAGQQVASNTYSPTAPGGPVSLGAASPPAANPTQNVSAPAPAAAQPQRVTPPAPAGQVLWAQRPSARRIADLYPDRALREGNGGRVELACTVRADLTLACAVANETPGDGGFGRAAMSAAGAYRARPTLSDGSASAGARTRIAIVFQPPNN